MITEELHGILNADGTLQVESNDRELRIYLSRIKIIDEGKVVETYRTTYYVKDDLEWQQTTDGENYDSPGVFLAAIRNAPDFAQAIRDIDEQKKARGLAGSRNV